MKTYHSIKTASERDIDSLLKTGWEIIDKTISSYDGTANNTSIVYHVGYPLEKQYNDLLSIVRLFEVNGFKEQLFDKLATDDGFDMSEYSDIGGGYPLIIEDIPVLETITKYENIVNNKKIKFYRSVKPSVFANGENEEDVF
ncbi:hypothetical protein BK128_18075 [Viridibacillus sp. FSL H7-0596]|uniref:hypothetical protein n=1 Tax=Viridibacillus sp. FSL H7-0596 TaxID=1928923 RepID=UPI00096D20F9|nr:hypothetical protein [Viridibacillus sp. FSL H7-0596]OMC83617.1 hypothetical protein BK128_18075 [Viridibacillus sp. FSL H7-0596]